MSKGLPQTSHIAPQRVKFTTTIDKDILREYREFCAEPIGRIIDGILLAKIMFRKQIGDFKK